MADFSIVIICKNEASVIQRTLQSLEGLTDDIVVYDNGSTDNTVDLASQLGARVIQGSWEGFGATKRKANAVARHDWILSLDADEAVSDRLREELQHLDLEEKNVVYDLPFQNFLGNKMLRFGEWGGDHHIRLFNRTTANWNDAAVHETLVLSPDITIRRLNGAVLHQTMKDMEEYSRKTIQYAMWWAENSFRKGKKATWFKIRLAPGFTFFNYFILKGGFLDGHEGYVCARMTTFYTFLKYSRLRELNKSVKQS